MKTINVLNAYSSLGGNRYKWDEAAEEANVKINVTAVELDAELAELYQERFPNDTVIVTDAHNFILNNIQKFNYCWSSPPCPSHSRARFARRETTTPIYPDLKLYEEIIFLQHYFKGKFCIENVIPYYEPLIPGKKRGRHLYWTNYNLPNVLSKRFTAIGSNKEQQKTKILNHEFKNLCQFHDYDFTKYKGSQRLDKIARNLVDYEAGKTIFQTALGIHKQQNANQKSLF